MCWFYSMPNLLVIQHLETLYLGGNNVRIVCEKMWRINQVCTIKRQLATGLWVEHAGSWRVRTVGSLLDKKYSLVILLSGDWNLLLILVASDSPVHPILLKNDFSHSFSCPTINNLIPTKCRELLEKILRDKS